MKLITAISLCIVFICSSVSYSQGLSENLGSHDPFKIDNEQYQPRSPALAGALSVGLTVGSILAGRSLLRNGNNTSGGILLATGLLAGPSAGNIYAGNGAGVGKGIGSRLLGGGGFILGGFIIFTNNFCIGLCQETSFDGYDALGTTLIIGGAGLFVYSTIHDWIRGADYAQEMNRKHANIQVAPGMDTHTGKPTLSLNIQF